MQKMSGWRKRQIVEAEERFDKINAMSLSEELVFWKAACAKYKDEESLFRKQICRIIKELEKQVEKQ